MMLKNARTRPGEQQVVPGYVLTLMEGLNCPRSLTVAILVRYREWDQLLNLECDPIAYIDSEEYWAAVTATDLLAKCRDIPFEGDLEGEAIKSFMKSEHDCLRTNLRLQPYIHGWSDPLCDVRILDFISRVRKTVYDMIGPGPRGVERYVKLSDDSFIGYTEDSPMGRFGPGATQSDAASACTVAHKLSSVPSITPNAASLMGPWNGTLWADAQADLGNVPIVIKGNSFFTVPKKANKLRGCAKEPSINVHYQMAYGRQLRARLAKWGVNLTSGQALHRKLAREGSVSGKIATIDLRSASDSNATNLVKLVAPKRWHEVLTDTRSTHTFINNEWVKLEKFSSMGNGFTFELETIVFAAIAYVACDGSALIGQNFSVYGDDIIVPVEQSLSVISALKFFGFTPNDRKTFLDGPFRESCGGDFYDGVGVRPYNIEEFPYEPQQYISLANGIRRLASQVTDPSIRDVRWDKLKKAWFQIQDNLPNQIRDCRGPEGLGDLVIHDSVDRCRTKTRCSIRYFRVYRPARYTWVRFSDFSAAVQLASAVYGVARNPMGNLIPRDSVAGYKVGWAASS